LSVSVIGAGEATAAEVSLAEEVGRLLAQRGVVLVCGGLGGVMEAACRGARSAGGLTVGVLPGYERSAANPWTDVALVTGLGEARNVIVAASGDGVIAVGGVRGNPERDCLCAETAPTRSGPGKLATGAEAPARTQQAPRGRDPRGGRRAALPRIGCLIERGKEPWMRQPARNCSPSLVRP